MPTKLDEDQNTGYKPPRNPGDMWNDAFNRKKSGSGNFNDIVDNSLSDVEAQGDRAILDDMIANDLSDVEARGNKIINDNADDPTGNATAVRQSEENPEWNNRVSTSQQPRSRVYGGSFGKIMFGFRKAGPGGTIAGVIIGGGTTISFMLSPSILLVHVKEIFHNDRADSTRTNQIFARAFLNYKFNSTGDKCTSAKVKIMCKLGTMSKAQLKEYRDAGFKISGEEVDEKGEKTGKNADQVDTSTNADPKDKNNRYSLSSIEFPDGHVSSTGSDAIAYGDKKPSMLQRLTNAFNPKSKFFQNKKFSEVITKVFKIKKGKAGTTYTEGEDDDAKKKRAEEFNGATNGASHDDAGNEARNLRRQVEDDTSSRANDGGEREGAKRPKTGGYTSLLRAICTGYKTVKIGVMTIQYEHYLKLVAFGMEFLKVADMIKAGAATGAAVSYITDKLTYSGPYDDPSKNGLNAMDSQGFKLAAHGDLTGLLSFAQKYILGGTDSSGALVTTIVGLAGAVSTIESAVQIMVNAANPTSHDISGRDAIKKACRAISGKASLLAQCAVAGSELVGITAETGPGAIISSAIAAKMCQCTLVPHSINHLLNEVPVVGGCDDVEKAISTAEKALVGIFAGIIGAAAEKVIQNWDIGSDTKGVDAGNALAASAALIGATAATSYALKPGTKTQYRDFVAYTDKVNNEYIALDKENAKQSPFDLTNQYSFISTLTQSLKTDDSGKSPLVSGFGNLFGLLPSAFSTLGSTAQGLYSEPIQKQEGRYDCNTPGHIQNDDLNYLGVDGDKFCSPIMYSPLGELQLADHQATDPKADPFSDVIEYMTHEQPKSEEDGGTKDTTSGCDSDCESDSTEASVNPDTGAPNPKSQYAKWIANCTEQRYANGKMWGAGGLTFDSGSDRDQDWDSGKECLKETKMLTYFRVWHNMCQQSGTADGTLSCSDNDQSQSGGGQCGDGSTESIYDCALQFDPYGYLWGGGHGGTAEQFMKDFKAGKYKAGEDAILDCSGLVRMAIYEAMGVDIGGLSVDEGTGAFNSPHLQEISLSEVKKGDLLTHPGHIEIAGGPAKGPATSGGIFPSFGAHTAGIPFPAQISTDDNMSATKAYRYVK